MIRETGSGQTPHPNPFTLAKIQRFYRHKGVPVEIKGERNMYILSKGGNPWFRIVYLQDQNEWFLDSWQPDSMVVTYWQQKKAAPDAAQLLVQGRKPPAATRPGPGGDPGPFGIKIHIAQELGKVLPLKLLQDIIGAVY